MLFELQVNYYKIIIFFIFNNPSRTGYGYNGLKIVTLTFLYSLVNSVVFIRQRLLFLSVNPVPRKLAFSPLKMPFSDNSGGETRKLCTYYSQCVFHFPNY